MSSYSDSFSRSRGLDSGYIRQRQLSLPGMGSSGLAQASDGALGVMTGGVGSEGADATRQYLSDYNQGREEKIRGLYGDALQSSLAQQKSAYDASEGALRTAYDENIGSLQTAHDSSMDSLKTAYDKSTGTLKTAYDKNLGSLSSAYEQNLADALYARDQISPQYRQAMNAAAGDYERQRRNNNMRAAASGLNSGAGSQLALGQNVAYQRNQGLLAQGEQSAINDANKGITDLGRNYNNARSNLETEYNNNQANLDTEYTNNQDKLKREFENQRHMYDTKYQNSLLDLKTDYQNKIAEATAQNDYQLAAALLDEYGAQYDRTMQQAQQLAEYGDFSMYAQIYGQAAAQQMEKNWALQNPDLAYNLGKLTADEYFQMTGKMPRMGVGGMFSAGGVFGAGATEGAGATGFAGISSFPGLSTFGLAQQNR